MNPIKRYGLLLAAAFILLVGLAACGPNAASNPTGLALDEQKVTTIVENMLNGYNTGDYEVFTKDLSPQMKIVINEESFQSFRTQTQATLGQFKSIASIEKVDSGDRLSWVVTAEFENSTEQFTITFNQSTGQIESLDFGQVP